MVITPSRFDSYLHPPTHAHARFIYTRTHVSSTHAHTFHLFVTRLDIQAVKWLNWNSSHSPLLRKMDSFPTCF